MHVCTFEDLLNPIRDYTAKTSTKPLNLHHNSSNTYFRNYIYAIHKFNSNYILYNNTVTA